MKRSILSSSILPHRTDSVRLFPLAPRDVHVLIIFAPSGCSLTHEADPVPWSTLSPALPMTLVSCSLPTNPYAPVHSLYSAVYFPAMTWAHKQQFVLKQVSA